MSGLCETSHAIDHLRDGVRRIDQEFCTTAKLEQRQDVELPGSIAVIDLANGEYIKATLLANVKSITFANWKPSPIVNRVTLEVNSKGRFSINLPWVRFPDGAAVSFSPDATVIFRIVSSDAGKTAFVSTIETYARKRNDAASSKTIDIGSKPIEPQRG